MTLKKEKKIVLRKISTKCLKKKKNYIYIYIYP